MTTYWTHDHYEDEPCRWECPAAYRPNSHSGCQVRRYPKRPELNWRQRIVHWALHGREFPDWRKCPDCMLPDPPGYTAPEDRCYDEPMRAAGRQP